MRVGGEPERQRGSPVRATIRRMHWGLLIGALGAGTSAGSAPSKAASPLEKVVFASPGAGSAVGLLSEVIKKNKLGERNGLALDIKYFDPAATEQAVVLRRADAGIFPVVSAVRVNLSGERIRLFAPALINHNSVVLQKGTTAAGLADLKGKRIGTLDRISMTYTSLATVAKMQGIDVERDFKLTLSPPPVLMGLFGRGELDALVIYEPLVTRLVSEGHKEMMRLDAAWRKETGQPMVALAIGAHEDWIKAHPEATRKLFQTVTEAIATIQKSPKAVVEEHRDFLGAKTDQELTRLAERIPGLYPTQWDRALIKSMDLLLRKNVDLGLLKEMPKEEIFVILK
jgi:NitT/TauT family transport system substrate-binding protein